MYVYILYIQYIYTPQVCMYTGVKSHTTEDEVVKPLIPRKNTVLNCNFVFDLSDIVQEWCKMRLACTFKIYENWCHDLRCINGNW